MEQSLNTKDTLKEGNSNITDMILLEFVLENLLISMTLNFVPY